MILHSTTQVKYILTTDKLLVRLYSFQRRKEMNYIYKLKIDTFNDQYLFHYVTNILLKKKYFLKDPIRPCDFIFNYILNNAQKKLYIALMLQPEWKECPICYETLNEYNTVQAMCGHHYCKDCFVRVLEKGIPTCACCRAEICCYYERYMESVIHLFYVIFNPCRYNDPCNDHDRKAFVFRKTRRNIHCKTTHM